MGEQPNLLFIFTDQQRYDTMRCYGNELIQTPNLDGLAEESFVFRNAYVSQPVCTAARSTIMTGLYPHTNGCYSNHIHLRPEVPTLAEMVSKDFLCGFFGKWHLGDEIVPVHGFQRRVVLEDRTYRHHYSKKEYLAKLSDYHYFLMENGFTPDIEVRGARVFSRPMAAKLPEPYTKATFLGQEAARFIRENRKNPFILYVSFLEPHGPFTGPFNDLYPPEKIPTGPGFLKKPPEDAPVPNRLLAEHYTQREDYEGLDLRTEAGWRKLRAQYLGLVTLVDRAVGEILGALDESGQADNTIVVFTSDHGEMMGDHGLVAKCVQYEEAIKVPLLIRAPWLGRGQNVVDGRISQVDLVPTLLDLLGEPVPEGLEGRSRAGLLRGEETLEGNDVFVEWIGHNGRHAGNRPGFPPDLSDVKTNRLLGLHWRTIVSAQGWKLNLSPEDRCELYDLNTDPFELENRIDEPGQQTRIRDLAHRIRRWQERTEDEVPLPSF